MGQSLSYCLKVCCSAALTAPWLYLLFTQTLNLNDNFTLSWLAFTLPVSLAFALPASVILNQLIKFFSNRKLSVRKQKLFLSSVLIMLCTTAVIISCGWDEAVNIYYKLAVTYIVVSIIFTWVYRLDV